ncbi:MAG: hypothetical protein AABX96_01700 [Nanoarchaeota archaeon]
MKILIIGSMKFHKKYEFLKKQLEKNKHQLIIPEPDKFYNEEKNIKLKAMQDFNKNLEKSDAILVANYEKHNQKNYIGFNSIMEIGMAFNRNKKIFILFNIPDNCKDELEAIGSIVLNGDIDKI